ncbi:UDP-N-acetylmuramoyl-L-alanine--D-glutamate ligase [Entomomonas asaccharolytica]|uniref:UDP-N-acetylmuramoylalanine--D-glutamate ligase n=1 Tax=Entomomonas asaccharolytica TaxID=2785331 RepID=A0A974NE77_9GAMM|nr:UDP-N-acetylmuramoyl-L-alanine--D-glutamate ligase [Entomomonas asaccharolytica]QQP84974.1 UDP-N-acetylmuramoyl-L-alanine--D-glutamate ligase [Entomomonas asaccharolytica]
MITTSDFYIVVGLGKSGMSLVRYLASQGASFAVADTRSNPPELATLKTDYPQVEVQCGELNVDFLCKAKTLFVSPGLDLKTPALQQAAKRGVKLSGDIDLFSQLAKAPIIAITGSNGKSTVTTLVGEMSKAAGRKVAVGGNLGEPALNLLADNIELYVLELSSFQLESCQQLNAEVATLLNVSEDHMDRYADLAAYSDAKQRIFLGAKQVVINLDDPRSAPKGTADTGVRWTFTTQVANSDFTGFKLDTLQGEGWIVFNNDPLLPLDKLKIRGSHNWSNAMAALALGHAVGLSFEAMIDALVNFKGLPHRCEWVAEKAGVVYYNDSKATNVGAALAAIDGLGRDISGKIVLVAGGDGKGADFSSLKEPIKNYCRAVILLGKDAPLIEEILDTAVPRIYVNSIEQAVTEASDLAKKNDAVLLAPACASWDMFKNFEERGLLFAEAVKRLSE